jgi:hypothetical protein
VGDLLIDADAGVRRIFVELHWSGFCPMFGEEGRADAVKLAGGDAGLDLIKHVAHGQGADAANFYQAAQIAIIADDHRIMLPDTVQGRAAA